jgi:hypothetical protein
LAQELGYVNVDDMMEAITLDQMAEWMAYFELHAEAQKTPARQATPAKAPRTHWLDLKGMMGTRVKPR